jgi:hypothetical protein
VTIYSSYSSTISALTLLPGRAPFTPRLFLLNPTVVFAARVNLPDAAEYPVGFIAYDTVTTGAYTAIKPGMTLLLGSTPLGDQYGRQRVRGPETPATTISIYVGRSSRGNLDGELTLVDNAYITVWDDRRVWAKIPFIDSAGGIFKDSDLEVSDRTSEPPPVAIMGEGDARTVATGTLVSTVSFNGQPSYATAAGATITDYLWDIADGTLTFGTLADDFITATFPAGFRYVSLTVTDSNGKSATTERPVFADDLDHTLSFDGFAIDSHRISDAGQQVTIRALEDMPRATYPDGTLAMLWSREPTATADRDHMLIIGWLDTEEANHNAGRTGLLRDTTLTIVDVAGRLDTLPGFAQSVADDTTRTGSPAVLAKIPNITWNYMVDPTMDLYMHYLLAWHSTALEVTDFYWSGTGTDYQIAIKNSDGESLWQQVWRIAQAMCPGYVLTCQAAGRLRVVPDPMLQESADRTAVVQQALTEDDFSDLRLTYQRAPRTHWLKTGALVVQSSITFNAAVGDAPPTVYLPTVFSWAPGLTPGQGLGQVDNNEQLAASQSVLNQATGHRYARLNAATGLLTLTLIQDDAAGSAVPWSAIEPALKEWVTLTLGADYAAQRGLTFATARCLPKELNIRYNTSKTGTTRTVELTLEPETSGQAAATYTPPSSIPKVGDQPAVIPPTIPPPDMGLITGQDLVAGIGKFKVYRTTNFTNPSGSGGPTWNAVDLTGSDEILTWVVDPFSPGYIDGAGTIDGWVATAAKVYRVTDLFGTPGCTAVVTFANSASWRTIQASFGTYFVTGSNPWLICISYYGSTGGHTGTWATYSVDGGTTWAAEVQVSSFYDSGGAVNPIGLYCSPKTPGLAYTAAHIATANPATTSGYVSHDWGATWTVMAADAPSAPLPYWGTLHGGVCTVAATPHVGLSVTASAANGGSGTTTDDPGTYYLLVAPPTNAVRVLITGTWTETRTCTGGSVFGVIYTGTITNGNGTNATATTDTLSKSSGATVNGASLTQDFTLEYTRGVGQTDWELSRDDMLLSAPTVFTGYCYISFHAAVSASLGRTATEALSITASMVEIELEDSTVYVPTTSVIQPVHGQGGEIHLPWPTNDDESVFYYGSLDRSGSTVIGLKRAVAGTVTDISKTVYGVNSGAFSIRTHDNDRSFALLAGESGAGNSGVWTSTNNGDTWTQIVAPTAVTHYQAAFGGDSEQIIYIYGPAQYFGYSSNFGSAIDSRAGNLAALSATKLIGVAGGPTP